MVISPLLNPLFELKRRIALLVTQGLVIMEFWFDGIMNQEAFGVGHAYQAIHFIVIYCCGRCISLYINELLQKKDVVWIMGYIVCSLITWSLYVMGLSFALNYSSIFVVGASCCIFLPFLRGRFENNFVNWVASGCFAVYVMQVVNPAFYYLCSIDSTLMATNSYSMYLLKAAIVIILFFFICVVFDKVREFVMKPINKYCFPILEKWCGKVIENI